MDLALIPVVLGARRVLFALGCLTLLLAAKPPASSIAVLALEVTLQGSDGWQQGTDALHKSVAKRFGLDVLPATTVFELPADWKDRLLRCGPDERCAQDQLRSLGADIAVVAIINRTVNPPILDLRLIGDLSDSLTQTSSRPESLMTEWVDQSLTEARYPKLGRLIVKVEPTDSVVMLNERIIEGPVATLMLPPGIHVVQAERSGFETRSLSVVVNASAETQIDIALNSQSVSWWPWAVGGGVAVAAGVVAAVLVTRGGDCLCVKKMGTECVSSCP